MITGTHHTDYDSHVKVSKMASNPIYLRCYYINLKEKAKLHVVEEVVQEKQTKFAKNS